MTTELSPREREVARLVAEGLPDREIAHTLLISIRTVHEYLDRIASKIGAELTLAPRRRAISRWVAQHPCP